jgi:WD40 repeat protein
MRRQILSDLPAGVLLGLAAALVSGPPCLAQWPKAVLRTEGKAVYCVAFSPDGRMLASGCVDGGVELWEVQTHRRRASLRGHTSWVRSLAFSPDGKLLAVGSENTTLALWDVRARRAELSSWVTPR